MRTEKSLAPQGPVLARPIPSYLVAASLAMGFLLTLLPWPASWHWLVPDFILVTLVYWNLRSPRQAGLGAAFLFGLLTDATLGTLLGQHALAYLLVAFITITFQRRLQNFPLWGRALQLAPLFVGQALLVLVSGPFFGRAVLDWRYLAAGGLAALLWPLAAWLLDWVTGWMNRHRVSAEDKP